MPNEKASKKATLCVCLTKGVKFWAGAVITNDIKEGVVRLPEGAWYDPNSKGLCRNGSANVLTLDIPTSKLANGNIAHTALVNIEKYKGKAEAVEVFKAPKYTSKSV